jgi:uncharacterized protein YbaP (TraB family)
VSAVLRPPSAARQLAFALAAGSALLLLGTAPASAQAPRAAPAAAAAAPEVEEIEVSAPHTGPRMWKVTRANDSAHVVWILGTLSPLPRHFIWQTDAVAAVLARSQEFIPDIPSEGLHFGPIMWIRIYLQWRKTRAIADHETLQQTIPAALYARFEAQKQKFAPREDSLENLRPMVAGGRLFNRALEGSGLNHREDDLSQTVTKLAHEKGVPVYKDKLKIDDPLGTMKDLNQIPPEAEQRCLLAMIERMESDMGTMQQRAAAWARGDVAALRQLPYPDEQTACLQAVSSVARVNTLMQQLQSGWMAAVEDSLTRNASALALQPMDRLLGDTGMLAQLRAKGYTITGP